MRTRSGEPFFIGSQLIRLADSMVRIILVKQYFLYLIPELSQEISIEKLAENGHNFSAR